MQQIQLLLIYRQKDKYTLYEIKNTMNEVEETTTLSTISECETKIKQLNKNELAEILNIFVESVDKKDNTKPKLIKQIKQYLQNAKIDKELLKELNEVLQIVNPSHQNLNLHNQVIKINDEIKNVDKSMKNIQDDLDKSIYGHDEAKRQILKIVGQWINGEQKVIVLGLKVLLV